MVRGLAHLLVLSATLLLMGCESGPAPANNEPPVIEAVAVDHGAWAKLGYSLDWQGFPYAGVPGKAETTALSPSKDIVLLQESGSTVVLVEASTGALRWSVDLTSPLTRFVDLRRDPESPQQVLVSSESELFTLAAQTGNFLRRDRFPRVVNTPSVCVGGIAVYGTTAGEVFAHQVATGLKTWGYRSRAGIEARPVKLENTVGVVSQDGEVLFITPAGKVSGRSKVFEGLANSPVTDGKYMFIAGLDQSVWAFDEHANMVWRYRTANPISAQPAVVQKMLVCDMPDTGLTAFETTTGKILWSNPAIHGTVIAARGGNLLVWDGSTAVLVEPSRGESIASTPLKDVARLAPDEFADGNLYVVSSTGSLCKFAPRR